MFFVLGFYCVIHEDVCGWGGGVLTRAEYSSDGSLPSIVYRYEFAWGQTLQNVRYSLYYMWHFIDFWVHGYFGAVNTRSRVCPFAVARSCRFRPLHRIAACKPRYDFVREKKKIDSFFGNW
jgi:hypothetical protein